MTELLFLVGVLLLVAANGFFVAAEFALVRRPAGTRGVARTRAGVARRSCSREIDKIDEYLSACQLGITMASLGIGWMGEPAIASLIEIAFGRLDLAPSLARDLARSPS